LHESYTCLVTPMDGDAARIAQYGCKVGGERKRERAGVGCEQMDWKAYR
jgi:hypothetical protein